jgi:protein involved in polysaccharide export with SLBB domain
MDVIAAENLATSMTHYRYFVCSTAHCGRWAATCLLTLMLYACGGLGLPRLPTTPAVEAGSASGASEAGDGSASGVDEDPPVPMALYPGDGVSLYMVSAETETVAGLTVDERGVLHVPLAGDVQVGGLPFVEAEARVEAALRDYDSAVRVTILLAEPRGQQATVMGAVGTPGRHPVTPGMRVGDLLALAGGATTGETRADLARTQLLREGESLPIDLRLALRGDPRHNVRVRPGDHLYVPPDLTNLVSVVGEVNSSAVLPYEPGLRLTRAIALAGGPSSIADLSRITVVRGSHDDPRVYEARLDRLLSGEDVDPLLAPGDVVHVGARGWVRASEILGVLLPLVSIAFSAATIAIVTTTGPGGGAGGLPATP